MRFLFNRKRTRVLSLVFAMIMFVQLTASYVSASEISKSSKPSVTFIDETGTERASDKSVDFFLQLAETEDNNTASPYVYPTEPLAIRISDVKTVTCNEGSANTAATSIVTFIFNSVWNKKGGDLIDSVTKGVITSSSWKGAIASTVIAIVVERIIKELSTVRCPTESYQYKSWNDFYDCYLVYQVIIFYTDASMETASHVDHWIVYSEKSNAVGLK